jgi:ketosteroid isomerase-like protein
MARHNPQLVRKPLTVREQSSRTLDQRLAIRFPRLNAAVLRLMTRLPPTSRIRQAALWRATRLAIEAYNRRDLEAVVTGFHPKLEYYPYREFVEAALAEPCYHGPDGYRAYITDTYEVWGTEVRLYPTELIDIGDRLVLLAEMPMRAQASGIPLAQTYATVATIKDGAIISQRDFLNQAEALESVGLAPLPSDRLRETPRA